MVLDALEGDLVTKSDFAIFQERLENRFTQIDTRFEQAQQFVRSEVKEMKSEIKETEFRLVTRLGFLIVSTVSIAVATLTWLIKT